MPSRSKWMGDVAVAVEKSDSTSEGTRAGIHSCHGRIDRGRRLLLGPEPRLEGLRAWFDYVHGPGLTALHPESTPRNGRAFPAFSSLPHTLTPFGCSSRCLKAPNCAHNWPPVRKPLTSRRRTCRIQRKAVTPSCPTSIARVMASVLRTVAAVPEPPKPKVRRVSHTVAPASRNSQQSDGDSLSIATTEDKFTAEAKAKATHDLEAVPGFASREDAESWLRTTPRWKTPRGARALAAAYQQEVNAELVSDSDKLIDESASLKSDLARLRVQALPGRARLGAVLERSAGPFGHRGVFSAWARRFGTTR